MQVVCLDIFEVVVYKQTIKVGVVWDVRIISWLHVCTGAEHCSFNHYSFHLVKLYLFLSLFLSSAVTVSFDSLSYTVAEDEILELCLMFQGELEHFLELNISLLSDSAGSKLDYCVVIYSGVHVYNWLV